MSPEQAEGKQTDHRADIYAVGVVLYEMLAGTPPFDAEAFGQLVVQIVREVPPPLGKESRGGEIIPQALSKIIFRCLAKDPSKRPTSMSKIAEALAPLSVNSRQTIELARGGRARRSRKWPIGVGAAMLLAGLGVWKYAPLPVGATIVPRGVAEMDHRTTLTPPLAEKPAKVVLRITSSPMGAKVTRVDTSVELGYTPLEIRVDREEREIPISFDLPGHDNARQNVSLNADTNISVVLKEQQAPEPGRPVKRHREKPNASKTNRDDVLDPFSG
jgi:serine/threonine-protein kinase